MSEIDTTWLDEHGPSLGITMQEAADNIREVITPEVAKAALDALDAAAPYRP